MNRALRNILLFGLGIGWITQAGAEPLVPPTQTLGLPPYVVELPITSYADAEREQGFSQALKAMLIQSSNNPSIINLPTIKTALTKPGLYIKQFNYLNKSIAADKSSLLLRITFDVKAIDKLLQRTSTTVMVNTQTSVLIWLAKDAGIGKILVEENVDEGLNSVLRATANELKLPLVLPMFDLQDRGSVKPYDICNLNQEAIKNASRRYQTQLIAIGCIKQPLLGKTWSGRWLLLQGAKSSSFNFVGESAESVVKQGLQTLANHMTKVVTPVSGPGTKVVLRVSNVNGLAQYNEVVRYLYAVSKIITQIDLINLSATEIELAVQVVGGEQALINGLNLQDKLIPNPEVTASPPGINLDYKWIT